MARRNQIQFSHSLTRKTKFKEIIMQRCKSVTVIVAMTELHSTVEKHNQEWGPNFWARGSFSENSPEWAIVTSSQGRACGRAWSQERALSVVCLELRECQWVSAGGHGIGWAGRGCTYWAQTGHGTKITFSSCDQCGITKMSTWRGQSEKCAFWEACSGHWVVNGSLEEQIEGKETIWKITVSTSIEMLMTEKRDMSIKMERRRRSQEKEVKLIDLHLYWMSYDGSDEGDECMEDWLTSGFGGGGLNHTSRETEIVAADSVDVLWGTCTVS